MTDKKPGLGIMIVEHSRPMAAPPKYGAPKDKTNPAAAVADFGKDPQAHEAAETPEHEADEEYGAKLVHDLTEPLTKLGMSDDDAKSTVADIFDAMAKCLRGDNGGEGKTMSEQYDDEGSQQFGGRGGYGS